MKNSVFFFALFLATYVSAAPHLIVMRHGIRANSAFHDHLDELLRNPSATSNVLTPWQVEWLRGNPRNSVIRDTFWNSMLSQHRWQPHDVGLWSMLDPAVIESTRHLIDSEHRPTIIIASPYLRTIQTAEIVQSIFAIHAGHQLDIVIDNRLAEWPHAVRQHSPHHDPIDFPRHRNYAHISDETWNPQILHSETTAETQHDHATRLRSVLLEYLASHPGALIVAHNIALGAADPIDLWGRTQPVVQGGIVVMTEHAVQSRYNPDQTLPRALPEHPCTVSSGTGSGNQSHTR